MNTQEIINYKELSVQEIPKDTIPSIEEIREQKEVPSLSLYFMKVGDILVKCSYAENGRSLEDCFLSYLQKKALLMDG